MSEREGTCSECGVRLMPAEQDICEPCRWKVDKRVAEIQAQIAENERRIAEAKAETSQRDRLKPIWMLRTLADQAAKDPQVIDWPEAVEALEAALVVAREEAT